MNSPNLSPASLSPTQAHDGVSPSILPVFSTLCPTQIVSSIDSVLQTSRTRIAELCCIAPADIRWDNFIVPLEQCFAHIEQVWSPIRHLHAVMNQPAWREPYQTSLSQLTLFHSEFNQNAVLYERFLALKKPAIWQTLTQEQGASVSHALQEFALNGVQLVAEQKQVFQGLQLRLQALETQFEEHVLDSTNHYALYLEDAAQLSGIPPHIISRAKQDAEADKRAGWKFTLHSACYTAVMRYAEYQPLRETLYRAYVTRASEFDEAQWNNTQLMYDILSLRQQMAQLLGHAHYGSLAMTTRMMTSAQQAIDFLRALAAQVKPIAIQELADLNSFAQTLAMTDLAAWDIAFVSEKLRQQHYAFSTQAVQAYFPLSRVIQGLFDLCTQLFGITFTPDNRVDVWHEDVRYYAITHPDKGQIGGFYLDLYARHGKQGGAWMDEAVCRHRQNERLTTPKAFLNCNFMAPLMGEETYLDHDEVITLFHEMGHTLHHLLTEVDTYSVSGLKGVEWDAIELPSQLLENFCWDWTVIHGMTAHRDTGAALPRDLFDKLLRAKNFQIGLSVLRQIEFGLFDLILHTEFDPAHESIQQVIERVRQEVAVVFPPTWHRFAHSFSHIFAGGYAAGYYSYLWSEVLSTDAYSLFAEQGVISAPIGQKYWQEILARGGSRAALDSFIAFRGRPPNMDALLQHIVQ